MHQAHKLLRLCVQTTLYSCSFLWDLLMSLVISYILLLHSLMALHLSRKTLTLQMMLLLLVTVPYSRFIFIN